MKNSEGLLSGTLGSKRIILLHSETSEGRLCSKALEETIKGAQGDAQLVDPTVKDCVQSRQIDGIKVNDPEAFKTNGLDNLQKIVQEFCGEPVAGNQPPPNLRFFNMTGGYKGLIPYATILAWDYAMSLCYLYDEESDRLIELPRPVKDWRPIYAEVVNQTGISAKEKYRGKSLA
jgi:CRISPR/Cas system-associated protein Csm6